VIRPTIDMGKMELMKKNEFTSSHIFQSVIEVKTSISKLQGTEAVAQTKYHHQAVKYSW